MAKDQSIVIIRGRLASDPELRTVGSQATPVANLRILSSGWEKDAAGQPVDLTPTSWNCEAWRSLAEHIAASLFRGSQVIVAARPKTDRFTAQDGTERWSTRYVIDDIGASLQRATVQITKTSAGRNGNQSQAAPAPTQGYARATQNNDDFDTREWQ